jgi:putative ABC transport system permease protein
MNIRATTRKSLADITRRPGRTLLIVLGIMVGILGLTALNVAGDALNAVFADGNNTSASPNLSFSVLSVDPTLAPTLAAMPNVQTVQIETRYQTRWHITNTPGHVGITVIGYQNFRYVKLNPFQLIGGRLPNNGEIVMEASNSQLQAVAVGEMVTVETAHGSVQLRVVGLARTLGLPVPIQSGVARAYMHSTALSQLTGRSAANEIEIKLYDKGKANETARAISTLLQRQHVTVFNTSLVQGIPAQSVSNSILSLMRMLAIIALLLTGLLIIVTMTTLVTEQTRVIGIMKAIGGTRLAVMRGYLFSISIYSLIGTLLGIGLGLLGGYELASFMLDVFTKNPGPFHIAPGIIMTSLVVGFGVPLVAALLPLWRGTGITVREAMTGYGVNTRGNASRRSGRQHLLWVPQTTWLGVRGIFRKRGRAILTLLALTLTGIAFLSIQTATASFDQYSRQFSGIYTDDATVILETPQPYDTMRLTALAVPNVARVEPIESCRVNTKWGQLALIGIQANTQMYLKDLIAGRWFAANETNVLVISQVAANKSGLQVGDRLTFSDATSTASWRIIGEVYDPTNPAEFGVGLTSVNNYATFKGGPSNLVQGFMLQGVNRAPQAVNRMVSRLDVALSRMGTVPTIQTEQEKFVVRGNTFALVDALFYAAGAIVALVGILGVFNTLTTSVLERRREIGVLRSLGATNWRVASVFWLEGIALVVIAWLLGVVLGIPGAYGFVLLLGMVFIQIPFAFNPFMLLYMFAFILLLVMLASLLPVLGAIRVRIAETLRYE